MKENGASKRCRYCDKIIKPVRGCWFQVFCTGGKCRDAFNKQQLKRGKELAKQELEA